MNQERHWKLFFLAHLAYGPALPYEYHPRQSLYPNVTQSGVANSGVLYGDFVLIGTSYFL